jgi:hypothetical protein
MMLDKGHIKDWDGEPEAGTAPAQPIPQGRIDRAISAIFESREAVPTGEHVKLSPEQKKARNRRGQWIALALFAFVIIVFTLTMTKMGASILVRDL